MTTSTEALAMELAAIRKRVSSPQLRKSALDNGSFIVTTPTGLVDAYGNPTPQTTGIVGVQYDGTTSSAVVAGPTPPQPVAPTVTATINGLEVYYSGAFVGGAVAPMDWARAEIHVAQVSAITGLSATTRKAIIPNANGATINITNLPAGVPHYVAVIAWSQAGKPSAVSAVVGPVSPLLMPPSLVDIDFNSLGTHIYYTTGATPAVTALTGDLWLKQLTSGPPPTYQTYRWNGTTWVLLADQTASDAVVAAVAAQAAADAKAKLFVQATTPTYSGPSATAYWVDTSVSGGNVTKIWNGSAWVTYQLGNGAIQPNSLVASTVLVTGSVTAALLEAIMVIGNVIIAGTATGAHARMTPTGFRVFRADPGGTLTPDEVIRMGTDTNDYFGVVNSLGVLVSSIDDTGSGSFANLNVAGDLIVKGLDLDDYLANVNQPVGQFHAVPPTPGGGNNYGPIVARVGIAEVNGMLVNGRRYSITWQCVWSPVVTNDEADFGMHVRDSNTDTAAAPVVTDAMLEHWLPPVVPGGRWTTASGIMFYTAVKTGRHRFLLSLARGAGTGSIGVVGGDSRFPMSMEIVDEGPAKPYTGQFSQGSGTFSGGVAPAPPPTPLTQYNTGWMVPAGWRTFRGSGGGVERFDTEGPVQGWDPSGFNGDGAGFWWWTIPNITGTVDEVWVWLYATHWYYNSGGTARLNIIKAGAQWPVDSYKLAGNYDVGGWPNPGSVQVNISGWKDYFLTSLGANQAIGVSVGTTGTTNEIWYGRFDGPSARLGIRYTQ